VGATNAGTDVHVFKNRVIDWIIADSAEHALELVLKHYDLRPENASTEQCSFEQLDDDELLRVKDDEGGSHTQTCGEWAATEPAGLLCSTEW
jgi:hypothetical protein